jgi:hypothetical protein
LETLIMGYYEIKPEVAGGFGRDTILDASTHPPRVERLHYELQGWLGDDILTTFPCHIVTDRLRRALEVLRPTGCEFADVKVTRSSTFHDIYGAREVPPFWWLKITGQAGVDDFGRSSRHRMVVSQRVFDLLSGFEMKHCRIEEYVGPTGETPDA